jgi:hypothetical protein
MASRFPHVFVLAILLVLTSTFFFAFTASVEAAAKKKTTRKTKPPVKQSDAALDFLDIMTVAKTELPRRLAPMPLETECAYLTKEKPAVEKGKPKPKQVRVFYAAARDTVTVGGQRVQRVTMKEDTFWWVQRSPVPESCLGVPLPIEDTSYGGPKWEGGVKRTTADVALFLGDLIEATTENDEGALKDSEDGRPEALHYLIGDWRVTEAIEPKGKHKSACHYLGCAIDIALCDWNKGCPPLPGKGKTAEQQGKLVDRTDYVPTMKERWKALWQVLWGLYFYEQSEKGRDICYGLNEVVRKTTYRKGPHFHLEVYPCRTNYVLSKNKKTGKWLVYDLFGVYARRVKELE